MRIGVNSPAVPGHLNPMISLARQLQKRGHEVVYFTNTASDPLVRAAGLNTLMFSPTHLRADMRAQLLARLSSSEGSEAFRCAFELLALASSDLIEEGPRLIRESKVEALVLDAIWRNLDLVAMHLGIPYAHVCNALHTDFTGNTPFFVYDWPYETGPDARARNLQGLREFLPFMVPTEAVMREYVEKTGMKLDRSDPYAAHSTLAQVTQTPREFDFPGEHWPAHFHYSGPLQDEEGRVAVEFPWEKLTGEPFIYASMGTLNNGSESVFRTILEAACAPGRQLVLSVGNNVDPERLRPFPSNTIVVKRCPQLQLLRKAALCICHAGLNTVLESLAQGVPLVAVPVANDQPGVAARIAFTKTGLFVPLKDLSVTKLRSLVDEVLSEPMYRQNAKAMQLAIQKTNGLELAADIIERAFGVDRARTAAG